MSRSEFDIIQRYFNRRTANREDVILGIGDDAAILQLPPAMQLAVTLDTLVAGVHFPAQTDPYAIGWKAAAVNISDLAAMGAEPAWATLSLTVPAANDAWLQAFSQGLFDALDGYQIQLVGGDTCRGPLAVSCQLHGFIPPGQAITRGGAAPGDAVYVTGTLGDAALALFILQNEIDLPAGSSDVLRQRLDQPQPRVAAGLNLRQRASAAIDISDGLLADLGHLCQASQVGALIELEQLPVSTAFMTAAEILRKQGSITDEQLKTLQLCGGDDYELCFTLPHSLSAEVERLLDCSRIGVIVEQRQLTCRDAQGQTFVPAAAGYDHFASGSGDAQPRAGA